jgi:hypothetical protein
MRSTVSVWAEGDIMTQKKKDVILGLVSGPEKEK